MIIIKPGLWLHKPSAKVIEIYELKPVPGSPLCFWGPDIGITYSGSADTQLVWDSDEWQGHIPVFIYDDNPENWAIWE